MSPSSADVSGTVVLSEVLSRLVVQTQNPEPRTSPVCCLPGKRCVWTLCSSRTHQTTADRVGVDQENPAASSCCPTDRSPAGG